MGLTGLTGPDQLHPGPPPCSGPRTPTQVPGAISPHHSDDAAGLVSIPPPGRCSMPGAGAASVPLAAPLLARVVGQGQPGGILQLQGHQDTHAAPWHSEAIKQTTSSIYWDNYGTIYLLKINEWHNILSCVIPKKASTAVHKHSDVACQTLNLKSLSLPEFQMWERWRQINMRRIDYNDS